MTAGVDIRIEGRAVGEGHCCFVVAEIGVNHNGSVDLARRLIDAAADCGADCVKFQTFRADDFVAASGPEYEYVSQGKPVREPMLEMFRRLELDRGAHAELFARARERGMVPLSTPADREAVDLLDSLGVGAFKIGSDDLVYTPLLEYVGSRRKPIILSTGMAGADDIERALGSLRRGGEDRIVLLHCVSEYPAPDASMNLRKLPALRERFQLPVGLSDHSRGSVAALGAVALGACIVEKHFTLDRGLPGPDHHFSADPAELAALVRDVRRLETALGKPDLKPTPAEVEMAALARRSIVAARDLPAGHHLEPEDLAYKRSGGAGAGLMPFERDKVVGRRTRVPVKAGTRLDVSLLE